MARVSYEYDGTASTETTANYTTPQETAREAVDTANQASYVSVAKQATVPLGTAEARIIMEVI